MLNSFIWKCLAIHVDQSIQETDIVGVSEKLKVARVDPEYLRIDNGPKYISKLWIYGPTSRVWDSIFRNMASLPTMQRPDNSTAVCDMSAWRHIGFHL